MTANEIGISGYGIPGGHPSSPARPNQEQLSHFARRHLSCNRLTGPPVLHLVAPLGTRLLDVEVTACRQGAQRDRRVSIRTPREDEGVAAAGAVAETPAERWRFSGGRDSEGAVRGTHVTPLRTLAFRVGRRVRMSFAPAGSPLRTAEPYVIWSLQDSSRNRWPRRQGLWVF